MKSKERHKLQQNVLADWIGRTIQEAKPYRTPILLGSSLVVLGLAIYFAWVRISSASTTLAWTEVNTALVTGDDSKLPDVISHYPKTNAAYTAAVMLGDLQLRRGCDEAFVDKTLANQDLSKAIDNYTIALEGSRVSSLREQATFGLAQAREAQGELEQAVGLYKEITTRWPNGAYAEAAAHRLQYLDQPSTKAFFDRFAHFNPRPTLSAEPGAGKLGSSLNVVPSEPPSAGTSSVKDLKLEGGKAGPSGAAAKAPNREKPATNK